MSATASDPHVAPLGSAPAGAIDRQESSQEVFANILCANLLIYSYYSYYFQLDDDKDIDTIILEWEHELYFPKRVCTCRSEFGVDDDGEVQQSIRL